MRLARHDLGTTHYTKQGTGWKVIHTEEYPTRSEAMRREKWLKSGIGREWLKTNIAGWSPSGNDETFGPPKAE